MVNTAPYKITRAFFFSCSCILALYNLWAYGEYNKCIKAGQPITYKVINMSVNPGTRGRNNAYYLNALYNNKVYPLEITYDTFDSIRNNELPNLYFSKNMHTVVSSWHKTKALRLVALGVFGAIFALLLIRIPKADK
jgi:hypothetical protein